MLDDPTNLGRIRQHSASLRRQQQRQTPQDRPKQEKKSSIRRQLTKYREMAFKSRNAIVSDSTQRVDLESDIGPVSVWQMIRAAITNTDSTLQTTVEDCKEIARQTSSPADFMIILEAFIECLAADQEMHRWGQVLRAMILLRVCINNVSEEVAAEFQDDPYVANILNGFDLRWFHDGPAGPNNVTPDAREMPTPNVPIGATGDLKMHLPSYDEVPHLQVRNSTLEGYLLEQANTLPNEPEADPIPHATSNNIAIVPPHTNSETLNIHPTGRYRPLPLPPTVWDRLHHAAVEWDSTSIATGLGQEPTSQTQIRQHVPPISQNTTRRPLPTPPVVLVDFTLADLYLPPYSPPPPNYDISYHGDHLLPNVENTVGSTELVNHPEEQLNIPISSVCNELDDFEYIDDNRNIDEEDEESSSQLAESDDSLDEVAAEPDDQAELMEDISTVMNATQIRLCDNVELDSGPEHVATVITDPPSLPSPSVLPTISAAENLLGRIEYLVSSPIAYGGFSDVFKGRMKVDEDRYEVVCIKSLRAVRMQSQHSEYSACMGKRMQREMDVWRRLDHPNIVPMKGYILDSESDENPSLVSPWYSNGNMLEYLSRNPFADRKKLVRQVAQGLIHLHNQSPAIVHGDIKGGNVLIDSNGNAALADFGLSQILQECPSNSASSGTLGSVR
ncbi:hypothetical protein FRC03_009664, partial [Tulasnella sp. 419]